MSTPEIRSWKESQDFSRLEESPYKEGESNLVGEEVGGNKNNLISEEKKEGDNKTGLTKAPEITPEQYSKNLSQKKLVVSNEVKNHEDWSPGIENPESAKKLASSLESRINSVV